LFVGGIVTLVAGVVDLGLDANLLMEGFAWR